MRVIAGTARSLPLKAPEGMGTRPTTDRIKETLFNMLQPYIGDGIFVDVFSGSGGIGIEALSRGAAKAYFIENDRRAVKCIQENLRFTRLEDKAVLLNQDASAAFWQVKEKVVDVIFMDPPYDNGLERQVMEAIKDRDFITEDTLIVIEASLNTDFSWAEEYGFRITKEKRYKTNKHMFIRRNA